MTWKCPNCGFDANPGTTAECEGGCGYLRLPDELLLISEATTQTLRMRIDTPVGRQLLLRTAGEEGRYASDPQFHVGKAPELGGWAIRHDPEARNPTFLDGVALGLSPSRLAPGAFVSIGPDKCRLRVEVAF
jgi:hypothetical protein